MRLPTLAVLAPLIPLAAADKLVTTVICLPSLCSYINGWWYTGYGSYWALGTDGCHGADQNGVPGLQDYCLDFSRSRGHFYFTNQPKRCLNVVSWEPIENTPTQTTSLMTWEEVACTW